MKKLNYKIFGEGEPLIVLHGLFGSLENWQTMAKRIAEKGFQVFIVDQRNHGKSPQSAKMSLKIMATDLKHFMETQSIDSAIIMGHSMGGKVAMTFANLFPEKVTKLIVVDIAQRAYENGHRKYFKAMKEVDLTSLNRRSDADETLKKYIPETGVRQFILKNLSRKERGYRWKFNLPVLEENYSELTKAIDFTEKTALETLFIRGANSNYITDQDFENIKNIYSHVALATVEHAGHWVHAENAEGFFDVVCLFILPNSKSALLDVIIE